MLLRGCLGLSFVLGFFDYVFFYFGLIVIVWFVCYFEGVFLCF